MALRYFQPRFLHLCLSLAIAIEDSCSSIHEPEPESRYLYAGHRLASKQVAAKLLLKQVGSSVLMSFVVFRHVYNSSLMFVFLGSYLTFSQCLFRNAHDISFSLTPLTVVCTPLLQAECEGSALISCTALLQRTPPTTHFPLSTFNIF